ncbi:hypothetical protein IQ264_25385 [Phormidium sp. LEGE 05292]|uniref:hypothetical protein n=1 Tax=[Phormidium] sp. LEGE 05292 TaxID=767427 RepID=UPI0018800ED3|nr:hypothetical protein [Phormidium sp. LEGE 05292]MBE9228748.1 hypothetical protein [Phormidium sp. LEGE 05292]
MKLNIYKLWLASSFSLCCLLAPITLSAQEISPQKLTNKFVSQNQLIVAKLVIQGIKTSNIVLSNSPTSQEKITNNVSRNAAITVSKNVKLRFLESQHRIGLGVKSGKKPPRKG